jgi:hypothetical protein
MDITNALIRKLGIGAKLDHDDISGIQSLPIAIKQLSGGETIVSEGERATNCCLCIDGFIYRAKNTSMAAARSCRCTYPAICPTCRASTCAAWTTI